MILLNPILIDTALGPVEAIRRSWMLAKRHFWRLFGFIMVIGILSFIVTQAAAVVFGSIAGLLGGATAAQIVGGLASIVVSTVVQVYFLVMLARIYRQLDVG
jgi:membrane-anchored glycerophosphoryl diester phosphodiesterase (GDPDase)